MKIEKLTGNSVYLHSCMMFGILAYC